MTITYEEIANGLVWSGLAFLVLSAITSITSQTHPEIISRKTHTQIEMWGWGLFILADVAIIIAKGVDWTILALTPLHIWLFYMAWKEWKDSNDDDDLKKRFKKWAKNKLPKLTIIKIRPIESEGS